MSSPKSSPYGLTGKIIQDIPLSQDVTQKLKHLYGKTSNTGGSVNQREVNLLKHQYFAVVIYFEYFELNTAVNLILRSVMLFSIFILYRFS